MTPGQREDLLASLNVGVPIDRAARAIRCSVAAIRSYAERDDDFALALERAECLSAHIRQQQEAEEEANRLAWVRAAQEGERARAAEEERQALAAPAKKSGKGETDADRWDKARLEAAEIAPGVLGLLLWMDYRLSSLGFHAFSPWWMWVLRGFYESLKRWLLCRVGRGGGKSTTLTRVAACEGIFGPRVIPPGQRWIWPFISVGTPDARRRIQEIQAILGAIGIVVSPRYPQGLPTIELDDAAGQAIAFVALASTIAGVSGPSTIGATIDEEAKLRDKAKNANPSTEILASLLQTFRARPGVHAIRCSSAWTTDGSHAQSIAEGDTAMVHVARVGAPFLEVVLRGLHDVAAWEEAHGNAAAAARIRAYAATVTADSPNIPTWLANPSISAIASREEVDGQPADSLEGVTRDVYWLRENASVPMPTAGPLVEVVPPGVSLDDLRALGERNRALVAPPVDAWGRPATGPYQVRGRSRGVL